MPRARWRRESKLGAGEVGPEKNMMAKGEKNPGKRRCVEVFSGVARGREGREVREHDYLEIGIGR